MRLTITMMKIELKRCRLVNVKGYFPRLPTAVNLFLKVSRTHSLNQREQDKKVLKTFRIILVPLDG